MKPYVLCVLLIVLSGQLKAQEETISFRIIDGVPADITEFPYQVSITFNGSHHCGGSIISRRFILTAAHCTHRVPINYFSVRVGSNKIDHDGKIYGVKKVHTHPNFTLFYENDVAVIELSKALKYSDKVRPIKLVKKDVELPPAGTMAMISGWGRTSFDALEMSPHLISLEIPLISYEVCKDLYKDERYIFDDKMFCAGNVEGGTDSCLGDSGGAFVIDGVQHGIVSWGVGCGLRDKPGVYASVARLRDYIYDMSGI